MFVSYFSTLLTTSLVATTLVSSHQSRLTSFTMWPWLLKFLVSSSTGSMSSSPLGRSLKTKTVNNNSYIFLPRGNLTSRIVWSVLSEILILILTIVLAMVDTTSWPELFFYLTIASVILLNVANGVYQNTVYGLAARLPFRYTGAVVLGSVSNSFL